MATELDTPIDLGNVYFQGVTFMEIRIPHQWIDETDPTPDSMKMDKTKIAIRYIVSSWAEDGTLLKTEDREVPFSSWTSGFKTDMKSILSKIEADAKANGLLGAGTDEPLD